MSSAVTNESVPNEGEPGYQEWSHPRRTHLRHQLFKAVLAIPDQDLPSARSRAAVMVNIADVIHGRINSRTVCVEFSRTNSSDDLQPNDGREPLFWMWFSLADWIWHREGVEALDEEFDPYTDARGAEFDAQPAAEIRAHLLAHVADSDLVWVARHELKFREFSHNSCSSMI